MTKYLQVTISAEDKNQANKILNNLLENKLITGGQIVNAPARFLWKGEIVNMDYYTLHSFTIDTHKKTIISEVKKLSIEEVPMISFTQMDGNDELLKWIAETVC